MQVVLHSRHLVMERRVVASADGAAEYRHTPPHQCHRNMHRGLKVYCDTYRGLSQNISLDSVGEGKVTNNSQKCRVMCRYRKHSVVIKYWRNVM